MLNLKKTVKEVKDNKKGLILFGGLFLTGVVAQAVILKEIDIIFEGFED